MTMLNRQREIEPESTSSMLLTAAIGSFASSARTVRRAAPATAYGSSLVRSTNE